MSALENEKKIENTVALDFSDYDSSNKEKRQKVVKKNYSLTRMEANHGSVQPIKDKEDIKRISEYFWIKRQYRNWCLFNVGCCTGFRASDLLRLKVSDVAATDMNGKVVVNFNAKLRVKEKKTNKYRILKVPVPALKCIQTYINVDGLSYDDWLFPSRQGSWKNSMRTNGGTSVSKSDVFRKYDANPKEMGDPLDVDSFGRIMRQIGKKLNLPVQLGSHSCRKTFGYQFIASHPNDVKALAWLQHSLNHSSQAITLRYIGLDEEVDDEYYSGIDYGVDTHSENEE